MSGYQYLFGENCAGSAVLTKAVARELGSARVRAPRDKKYGPGFDLLDDRVFGQAQAEVKARLVFYEHYAPTCSTFTYAQAQYQQRSMAAPYGEAIVRPQVDADSKLATRVCKLASMKHMVGDAFSIEHVWPTPMLQFQCVQALLAQPGVFHFTWDNCEYGEGYRHRQVMITNLPCLAHLSRDCSRRHTHLTIGFDKDVTTGAVEAYAPRLVAEWARLLGQFARTATRAVYSVCGQRRKKFGE
ncbi:MAG: hypothetical protein GY772_11185 [bacterium]|nr:hypothetical protein [bacterium]